MRIIPVVLIAILLLASTVTAADKNGQESKTRTYINGNTCGQVINTIEKQENRRQLALIVGSFISGANYVKKRDSKIELKNMLNVTENFCRKNPKKSLMNALILLDRVIDRQILLSQKNSATGQ